MQGQFEGGDNKAQMSDASGNYSRAVSDGGNMVTVAVNEFTRVACMQVH